MIVRKTDIDSEVLGSEMVKALSYEPEGRGFKTRWGKLVAFNLPNPSGCTRPWGSLSL
jgi:hypothetical protein